MGFTAGAFSPWLLALVGVRKEGQRRRSVAGAIHDGYGWVARRWEVHRIWGRAADIRLVRLGRREVGDERRHPACRVQRGGLSRGRRREGVGMESDALRIVRRSPFSRGGGAFAAGDVRALVALG